MGVPGARYVGTVTGWGATGVGEWAVSRVPADMAIVVPATMPMVTPLPLGGGMGAGVHRCRHAIGLHHRGVVDDVRGAAYRGCV